MGYDVQHHTFIRCGLNKRKPKLDQFSQRKPFSDTTLVAFHLLSSEDNMMLNVCKTITLTFARHISEGKEVFLFRFCLVFFCFPFFYSSRVL